MASFHNLDCGVPCPATTGRPPLLAESFPRAAHSNAAVDAAVVAHLELATLQRTNLTSALSQPGAVVA